MSIPTISLPREASHLWPLALCWALIFLFLYQLRPFMQKIPPPPLPPAHHPMESDTTFWPAVPSKLIWQAGPDSVKSPTNNTAIGYNSRYSSDVLHSITTGTDNITLFNPKSSANKTCLPPTDASAICGH